MLKLFIQSSKTDQYRDGAWIVVASSGKATCPVAMMNPGRYLERAGLSCNSPLFCQLSKTKCGYKPRTKGLSYSRLRELVPEARLLKILYVQDSLSSRLSVSKALGI